MDEGGRGKGVHGKGGWKEEGHERGASVKEEKEMILWWEGKVRGGR